MHFTSLPSLPLMVITRATPASQHTWLMLEDRVMPFTYIFNATSSPSLQRKNGLRCLSLCFVQQQAQRLLSSVGCQWVCCIPHQAVPWGGIYFTGTLYTEYWLCLVCNFYTGAWIKIFKILRCTWKSAHAPDDSTAPLLLNIYMYIYIRKS